MIIKYKPNGEKICSTFMGGGGEDDLDQEGGIAIYGNSVFVTAITDGGYPTTAGVAQFVHGGGSKGTTDVFVAAICINVCEAKLLGLNFSASTTSVCTNEAIKFTPSVNNSCDTTGYKFHWEFAGGNPATSNEVEPTVSFTSTGPHDVKLVITTLCKKDSLIKSSYIVTTACNTCNLAGQFTKGLSGCSDCGCKEWVLVNAINGTPPYTYLWPDGYVKRYKNKLCPGNYNVKVTDKNGCSVDVNVVSP